VRHKLTRKDARKIMPRGKPYARRKTTRKPRGSYRGAVLPRWMKGETKHILANDNCNSSENTSVDGNNTTTYEMNARAGETAMNIGDIKVWTMNPCAQGTKAFERNGRSIDGTYLRVQGHVRNDSSNKKCYVRMMALSVKGGSDVSGDRSGAPFVKDQLFKRIDDSIAGFAVPAASTAGSGSAAVRTLQLGVNKNLYTVLFDQKFQLADNGESFGSQDRLFDFKTKLKTRSKFGGTGAFSHEKGQIIFVVMTVDPLCGEVDADLATDGALNSKIALEFESKYSYKDF